jgi:hypothetical protein
MARVVPGWLILVLVAALLLAPVQRARAAGLADTPTDTPTATETPVPTDTPIPTPTLAPTPTATPNYVTGITLDSGNTLIIERRWTFGELADFLAIVAFMALYGLRWMYDIARREVR